LQLTFSQRFVFLALLLLFQLECNAGRAREFTNNKNVYVTEWSKLKHQAELGDPDALFALGNFHFQPPKGSAIRQNHKKAGELYFQASLRMNPSAQYNIALMLHQGLGFKADKLESYVWFYLASVNPSPVAKHINRKTAQIAEQLSAELNEVQLQQAQSKILNYQKIMQSKRYRDAKLPAQN
jgi:hypothetical protein